MKLVLVALIVLTTGFQDQHEGQPEYCVNHTQSEKWPQTPRHACKCSRPCSKEHPEDPGCLKFCHRDDCHCVNTACQTEH